MKNSDRFQESLEIQRNNIIMKPETEVHEAMSAINTAWRIGRVSEMIPYLHPEIVAKFPGFSGEIIGREKLMASFVEFCTNARVLDYTESDEQINVIDECAVVSYRFDMVYERSAYREHSQGRDFWVFQRRSGHWLAVWRTLFDLVASREQKGKTET